MLYERFLHAVHAEDRRVSIRGRQIQVAILAAAVVRFVELIGREAEVELLLRRRERIEEPRDADAPRERRRARRPAVPGAPFVDRRGDVGGAWYRGIGEMSEGSGIEGV
jgi:hypothetical protein